MTDFLRSYIKVGAVEAWKWKLYCSSIGPVLIHMVGAAVGKVFPFFRANERNDKHPQWRRRASVVTGCSTVHFVLDY